VEIFCISPSGCVYFLFLLNDFVSTFDHVILLFFCHFMFNLGCFEF